MCRCEGLGFSEFRGLEFIEFRVVGVLAVRFRC